MLNRHHLLRFIGLTLFYLIPCATSGESPASSPVVLEAYSSAKWWTFSLPVASPSSFERHHFANKVEPIARFFTLSPDRTRTAYCRILDTSDRCVGMYLGDRPLPERLPLGRITIRFSPDSRRAAFVGAHQVFESKTPRNTASRTYQYVTDVTYSANSERYAYYAFDKGQWHAVIDGVPGPGFPEIDNRKFHFSSDGRRYAYGVKRPNGDWAMIVNGKIESPFDFAPSDFTFDSNGRRYAYVGERDNTQSLVVDGQAKAVFQRIGPPLFSPDGKRLAYSVLDKEGWHLFLDEKRGPAWDKILQTRFSSDGRHTAYLAEKGGQRALVIDEKVELQAEAATSIWFRDDAARPSYIIKNGDTWKVYIDGALLAEHKDSNGAATGHLGSSNDILANRTTGLSSWPIVFSWDGKRVAHPVVNEQGIQISVDGQLGPTMSWIDPGSVRFSDDSRHLLYTGRIYGEPDDMRVVIDGQPGPSYQLLPDTRPSFGPGEAVWYFAVTKDASVMLVRQFQIAQ